jgi:integrase
MAVKVTLREKEIQNGKQSLYLDYYPAIINNVGKSTRREFLKMYIFKNPSGAEEKSHNKTTLQIANRIQESRSLSIYNEEYGFKKNVELNINFIDYFKKVIEVKQDETSKSNYQSWLACFSYYQTYAKNHIYTKSLTKKHVEGFKKFLLNVKSKKTKKKLSSSTVGSYFQNLITVINTAYEDEILKRDITKGIKNVKVQSKLREYLTIEELNKLWKTPVKEDVVKYLCFFCAYTGFRFVEASKVKWSDITKDNSGNHVIRSHHTKGDKFTANPISKDAYNLLEKQKPNDVRGKVFDIKYSKAYRLLKQWVKDAGIHKKITLHNFRHTYAILQMESGTELFTVSKMLGHKHITTTMIYAKITDKLKNETLDKINLNTKDSNN